jgi:fructoselysine-6-P-deglycase FrlB-like protein
VIVIHTGAAVAGLDELVEGALRSEFFTAPRLAADLTSFLAEQGGRTRQLAKRAAVGEFDHVYFVGSGGSWSGMYSGKHLLDHFGPLAADALTSYELAWRQPAALGSRSLVVLASYSGATEDTLAALRYANTCGAHTVALVRRHPSPMAREAAEVIDYDSGALYALPLAAVHLFALELARLTGGPRAAEAESALARLPELPSLLHRVFQETQLPMQEEARRFLSSNLLYVLAAGPLYGLAYKFALTVFMENIRIHGSVIESTELRHGPVEMLERQRADMVFLLGTDQSRPLTERALDVAARNGARTLALDAAMYGDVHPLLTPFVLLVPLQWFTVYSALLRGITDLDERVFMGRGVLAAGPDATWP